MATTSNPSEAQAESASAESPDAIREIVRKNTAGIVIERYKLKNSKMWGKHERFYNSGKPSFVTDYDGSRMLSETEYFEDGQVKRKSKYEPEKAREIKRDEFYQNGKPKLSISTRFNNNHTKTTQFKEYSDSGQLRSEGTRVGSTFTSSLGDYDGEIKFYSETGELISTENYKDQKKDGLQREISIDENKRPIAIESQYEKGTLQKRTTIDGKTKKPIRIQVYMPDGSIKSDQKL